MARKDLPLQQIDFGKEGGARAMVRHCIIYLSLYSDRLYNLLGKVVLLFCILETFGVSILLRSAMYRREADIAFLLRKTAECTLDKQSKL